MSGILIKRLNETHAKLAELQDRYDFVMTQCRDAQDALGALQKYMQTKQNSAVLDAPQVPPGHVLCPVAWLIEMRLRVNTLVALSLKAERVSYGIAMKRDIADMMNSGNNPAPVDNKDK